LGCNALVRPYLGRIRASSEISYSIPYRLGYIYLNDSLEYLYKNAPIFKSNGQKMSKLEPARARQQRIPQATRAASFDQVH